jgi:uncharacterized membrane protein
MSAPGEPSADRLRVPGVVLGMGLGGFVDGIVIHQLLGWHHMLSSWYPLTSRHNEHINMIGDGLFHLACWSLVVAGIALLVRAARQSTPGAGRRLTGWMVSGWGVFNIIEGTVDHLVLGVHHVRPGPHQLAYDLGFVVFGAVLTVAGWRFARGPVIRAASPVR